MDKWILFFPTEPRILLKTIFLAAITKLKQYFLKMKYICLDRAFDIISLLSSHLLISIFYWIKPRLLVKAFKASPQLILAQLSSTVFFLKTSLYILPFPKHKLISHILFTFSGHSFHLECSCPCFISFVLSPDTYFSPANPSWSLPRWHSLLPLISFLYTSSITPLFSFCLEP